MADLRAVCFIPAIDCLIYHDVEHWTEIFQVRSGVEPTDLVLPAFVEAGSSYDSEYSTVQARLGPENTFSQWVEEARKSLPDVTIWGSIVPNLPTLANDLVALRDQWDESMEDCCMVNPTVQEMLSRLFAELRSLGADGVALDLTDAFPNSTSNRYPGDRNRRPLQNTCFCRYCTDALKKEAKWTEGSALFRPAQRNPARFVLRGTASGATPIDVRDQWLDKLDASDLVDFAEIRGFVENEDEESRQDALKLLKYLTARTKVTAGAVKRLCDAASAAGLRTAVILGSPLYDMSQNTNLTTLVKFQCADEYWAPSFEQDHLDKTGPTLLRFLAARSSYYFNATFVHLDALAESKSSEQAEERFDAITREVSALPARNEFNRGQCAQIPLFKGIAGFIGVPFDKSEFMDLITRRAADGSISERLKTDLLAKLESGATRITAEDQDSRSSKPDVWS